MDRTTSFAIDLARRAGAMVLKERAKLGRQDYQSKSPEEIVTVADLRANEWLIKTIKKRFPMHDILSEETGDENRPSLWRWIIDPIDGTTNFLIKHPLFAVSLSLWKEDEPSVAVTYAPLLDECFVAQAGEGTRLNKDRVRVSSTHRLAEAIIDFPNPHPKHGTLKALRHQQHLVPFIRSGRHFGSACLSLAYVAAGFIDGSFMVGPNPLWDVGAGVLLVREAGGRVTDFHGRTWHTGSDSILATNGRVHEAMLKKMKKS